MSCKIVFKRGIEICIISSGLLWACWAYLRNSNHLPVLLIRTSCTHQERRGRPAVSEWPKVLELVIPVGVRPSFPYCWGRLGQDLGLGPEGWPGVGVLPDRVWGWKDQRRSLRARVLYKKKPGSGASGHTVSGGKCKRGIGRGLRAGESGAWSEVSKDVGPNSRDPGAVSWGRRIGLLRRVRIKETVLGFSAG